MLPDAALMLPFAFLFDRIKITLRQLLLLPYGGKSLDLLFISLQTGGSYLRPAD